MTECTILLEAKHPSQNVMRSYFISAWYDLFDRLMVEVIHGRIGAKGKTSVFYMSNQEEAIAFIMTILKKRESSVKRNGAPYLLKYYESHWDLDEAVFSFRQIPLFDDQHVIAEKKQPSTRTIIKEGEGLFG